MSGEKKARKITDKMRLDWLDKKKVNTGHLGNKKTWFWMISRSGKGGIRQAIDAEMSQPDDLEERGE